MAPDEIVTFPETECAEVTQWFHELPPREELGDEHVPVLMAIEAHRTQATHTADCFCQQTVH